MVMTSFKMKIQLVYSYCCLQVVIILKWELRKIVELTSGLKKVKGSDYLLS